MRYTVEQYKFSERLIDVYANVYLGFNSREKSVDYIKCVYRQDAISHSICMLNLQIDMVEDGIDLLSLGEVKDERFYEEVIELMKTLREDDKN